MWTLLMSATSGCCSVAAQLFCRHACMLYAKDVIQVLLLGLM